ncbi:MAG: hypothetical protein IJ661_10320 [Lachnospiraceae bacterium]|nr:hypothetical protein [Lachnospiraceae bacterium]
MGSADLKKSQLHKRRNRGAAMIVVVCVMAVVMILSLTLIMAAYQMLATVSDEGRDEVYYQQVMSFSKVLRQRLEDNGAAGAGSDSLIDHINKFMTDEAYKDADTEALEAAAPTSDGVYGSITLVLDKKSSHGNLVVTISVADGNTTMSSCTCKYEVHEEAGAVKYTFKGYY